ncbi:D,D-heptose 1,7-bisphosphate phosphatase [Planctomycetaceae bacterium SCGC AG-212-F19]|nr:D,D-heptose 1,7-bisphosphate phosphatase [Planctomycetaceae bacterium SCGC AG-212-F19]
MNRAVFLDRDGVLNRAVIRDGKPYPPATLAEFELLPGVPLALERLARAGFELIVVTNQPDVAKGVQRREVVEAFHDSLRASLPIDDIRVCYHLDEHNCACRKPKPGMLLDAALGRNVSLGRSFMVGDRWRDVAAGRNAGCRTLLIASGYRERPAARPDWVVGSLLEASGIICARAHAEEAGHAQRRP